MPARRGKTMPLSGARRRPDEEGMGNGRRRLRILLSEGSSLSARQTLYALAALPAVIDVCDPRPLFCLARYSRLVRTCWRCPPFSADPAGYIDFVLERTHKERYDVLLPVHDQAFLLARFQHLLRPWVGLPVPSFAAI